MQHRCLKTKSLSLMNLRGKIHAFDQKTTSHVFKSFYLWQNYRPLFTGELGSVSQFFRQIHNKPQCMFMDGWI